MTSQGAKPQLVVTDRQSILERARERKHGKWIERILIQCRKTLTGVCFKEFKDIPEQIWNLPKLTGQASYPAWRLAEHLLLRREWSSRPTPARRRAAPSLRIRTSSSANATSANSCGRLHACLLYTSDAADE